MTDRIELLDDLGERFAHVAAAAEVRTRMPSALPTRWFTDGLRGRTLGIAVGITALMAGTAYAVPATRSAVDSITGSLTAWVSGESDHAPGRAVESNDNAPRWAVSGDGRDVRLIAETDGVGLYVRRQDTGDGPLLYFSLGPGRSIGNTLEGWRERLGEHAAIVLGEAVFADQRGSLDDQGRVPLFGVTRRDVERIELRYAEGPSQMQTTGDGGFVLLVDAWRPMREMIAFDRTGQVLDQIDMTTTDLRYVCAKEPGCPPNPQSDKN